MGKNQILFKIIGENKKKYGENRHIDKVDFVFFLSFFKKTC